MMMNSELHPSENWVDEWLNTASSFLLLWISMEQFLELTQQKREENFVLPNSTELDIFRQ